MPYSTTTPGTRRRNRTFPVQQKNVPGQSLPPTQRAFGKAVTARGPSNIGSDARDNRRGKPFSLSWNYAAGTAEATFGSNGTFTIEWIDYYLFTEIKSAGNPLRRFNQLAKLHAP